MTKAHAQDQDEHQYLDCIAMKRAIQEQIAAETKGMTPRDRLAYYRKLASESPFASLISRRSRVRQKTNIPR
jgi:hypothetical protein